MNATLEQIAEKIKESKKIAIYGHQKTDCDCVSSMLALSLMCESLDKKTELFVDSEFDETIFSLPGIDKINLASNGQKADLLISVDTATSERLGKYRTEFLVHNNTCRIDHHGNTKGYAKFDYVDSTLPANCLVLKELQKLLKVKNSHLLNQLLLSGTISDTGCFRFDTTTSKTFRIAAEMMDGLKGGYNDIVCAQFNNYSKHKVMVEAYSVQNAQFFCDDKVALTFFSQETMNQLQTDLTESSHRVLRLLDIKTVKISISITEEQPGRYAVSFRSKGKYNVSCCAEAFGGGGHVGASGCKVSGRADQVIKRVVSEAIKVVENTENAN